MRIKCSVEGITPLLCQRYTPEAALAATEGTRGSSAAADRGTPREIAESRLYLDDKGKPCIPQPNLLRSIVDGGSFHKIGKKQVTTKESSMIYSCLDVVGVTIPIIHKQPWSVDAVPVVIPATKGRILCYRPRFDDWRLDFEMELDLTIMTAKFMRAVVDDAGKRCGLGDRRPAKKGPYGRYIVVHWQEMPEVVAAEKRFNAA